MNNYEKYINKLKNYKESINYDTMYSEIEKKISKTPVFTLSKTRLAFGTAFLAVILCFSFYLYTKPYDIDLISYVLDQEINGEKQSHIVNYILNE